MMRISSVLTTASAVLLMAGAASAQVVQTAPPIITTPAPPPPVAPGPRGEPVADVPLLGAATTRAPTCGDIGLAAPASCVSAPLAAMSDVAEAYIEHYKGLGWLVADGDANRVIMIHRRDGGGCDAMQMMAFYDTTRFAAPELPSYLAFATIPGNICAAPSTPAPGAAQ